MQQEPDRSTAKAGQPVDKRASGDRWGIAGIQAALDLANARVASLWWRVAVARGRMASSTRRFRTMDWLDLNPRPKAMDVGRHPLITVITTRRSRLQGRPQGISV